MLSQALKQNHKVKSFVLVILLSWLYALCAQPLINLPLVPIYLHPLPLFLAVYFLGPRAVYGWVLYIVQGVLGAPFFSLGRSGIVHLCGPTGGYIIGMLIASIFLLGVRRYRRSSVMFTCIKVFLANVFVYLFGLAQLSLFVPYDRLLMVGFYPFVGGCLLKMGFFVLLVKLAWDKTYSH